MVAEAAPDSAAEKTKEEVRSLLYSAARDCVPEQRNSLVAFQSQTGVEWLSNLPDGFALQLETRNFV
ncbi:hypothetical protein ACMD2_01782 [Ananas comosus]|uniref:Uncharacterized protein n=1 Tax=Ananas comosus TaxID=4615 RepID=A0A199VXK7_ANACO|nr:hypothetical protein ACMD2_01782 [Ananas comosus]